MKENITTTLLAFPVFLIGPGKEGCPTRAWEGFPDTQQELGKGSRKGFREKGSRKTAPAKGSQKGFPKRGFRKGGLPLLIIFIKITINK